jgi:putative cell wall-binding protein
VASFVSNRLRRRVAVVIATALVVATGATAVPQASATSTFGFVRLAGVDRYATSAAVAEQAFSTAPTVILATGANYPDALAASYLAGTLAAPILLTTPGLPLSPSTTAALTFLKTKTLILLGGTSAISQAEQNALGGMSSPAGGNFSVSRISGITRYDTMAAIDSTPGASAAGLFNGKKTAFLATGQDFPDALGAGPVSYALKFPVILTEGQTLSLQATATLRNLSIQQVIILGGTGAIAAGVEAAVNAMGISTLARIAGVDRSNTSTLLADFVINNLGFRATSVNIASGDEAFGGADALSSGPLGGTELVPTIVTDSVSNAGSAASFIAEHSATLASGFAIGGTGPLPDALLTPLVTSGGGGGGGSSSTTPLGSAGIACGTAPTVGTSGSTGESGATVLPELTSASLISLTTAAGATPTNPAGALLRFTFSIAVSGAPPVPADFHLTNVDGTRPVANAASTAQGEVGATNNVDVLFAGINTPALFDNLGYASVVPGAVTSLAVQTNPDAAAAIGGRVNLAAGHTDAPDVQSFSGFRTAAALGSVIVDLTFDCSTYPVAAAGYHAILVDNFALACTGPAPGNLNPNGGTAVGGAATTVISISCPTVAGDPNNTNFNAHPVTASEVARFFIDPGTVQDVNGVHNALESTGTAATTGMWVAPDLTSASAAPNVLVGLTPRDQVTYNFDQPILPGSINPLGFDFVTKTAGTIAGAAIGAAPVVGNQDAVLVTYPVGTLTNVVSTYVAAGTVTEAVGLGLTNQPGAYGIVGSTTVGATVTPDFVSAAFGGVAGTVVYTFDKPPAGPVAGSFHVYLQNGTVINGTAASAPVGNTVTVTAFSAPITGAVLATVDAGAAGNAVEAGGGV